MKETKKMNDEKLYLLLKEIRKEIDSRQFAVMEKYNFKYPLTARQKIKQFKEQLKGVK